MWGNITIAFLLAFITSFVITPYTMRLAHKVGAIDFPGERKIHNKPIPRLGGLAIISGSIFIVYIKHRKNNKFSRNRKLWNKTDGIFSRNYNIGNNMFHR